MKKILLSRGVKPMRDGKRSAKDYPHWAELKGLLISNGYQVDEITEMPLDNLKEFIESADTVIAPDSFIQHFCWSIGKQAIVLWGVGDPAIFGHKENINLLKSRNNLREKQFNFWEGQEHKNEVFMTPTEIIKVVKKHFPTQ